MEYVPIFVIEDVLAILKTFQTLVPKAFVSRRISFPDTIFIPSHMDSILRLLIRCLSYQSPQIGSFLNVHMRADVTKVPSSLPFSPDHFAAVRSRAVQQPPALAAGDARL